MGKGNFVNSEFREVEGMVQTIDQVVGECTVHYFPESILDLHVVDGDTVR